MGPSHTEESGMLTISLRDSLKCLALYWILEKYHALAIMEFECLRVDLREILGSGLAIKHPSITVNAS